MSSSRHNVRTIDDYRRYPTNLPSPPQSYNRLALGRPPPFIDDRPSVIVAGVVGLCCTTFLANFWAEDQSQSQLNHKPLSFIRRNLVCSLANVRAGRWWVIPSSSITHFDLVHLSCNLSTLWSFGRLVIRLFGVPVFLSTWITSQLFCCGAALLWDAKGMHMTRILDRRTPGAFITYGGSIGASGALMGLIGLMTAWNPDFPMKVGGIPLIARQNAGVVVGGSIFCMITGSLPKLSHAGHLGGFIGGLMSY